MTGSRELAARRAARVVVAVALTLFVVVLWFSRADAAECAEGQVTWQEGSPLWNPTVETADLNLAIVGHFLWVQAEGGVDEYDGTVSHDLPGDVTGVTVCGVDDVTFRRADPMTVPVVVDIPPPVWFDLALRIGPR